MHIVREDNTPNTIEGYDACSVKINGQLYHGALIVSAHEIITDWFPPSVKELTIDHLSAFLSLRPDIILIGHKNTSQHPPIALLSALSQQRIGFEIMSIDAACRTFNVLLAENRRVILGLLMEQ